MSKKRKAAEIFVSALFWLAVWEIISLIVGKEIILPSPLRVLKRLFYLLGTSEYHVSVLSSLLRISIGYLLGTVFGSVLAYASFFSRALGVLFSPLFTVIRATPVASFIILALVWMGKELVPAFTAFLMVLPIIYGSVLTGLESTDAALAEVAEVYSFGFFKRLKLLYIPSSIPSFAGGAKTALGMSWKAGIAAEVLCSLRNSIGGNVYTSKLYLESVDLMAWTLTVIVISLVLEVLISSLFSAVLKKYTALQCPLKITEGE